MCLSCARHGARPSWSQRQVILIVERDLMWLDRYSAVCQECPDLVAFYESPDGRIALLLRHTLVPLPEEFASLRRTTRSAARAAADKLRAAGFRGGLMVLQWQPLGTTAAVMRDWPCRYEADATRRAQLTAVAERYAAEERYLARQLQSRRPPSRRPLGAPPPFAASGELHGLQSWYDGVEPSWRRMGAVLRGALGVSTHR